jgi:membrane protein YdbS with pleckstrin-like domain
MSPNDNNLEKILKWIVVMVLAVVALKIVFGALALAWVIGGFLLSKVLPLVLLVWLVMKLVEWYKGRSAESPAEAEA